MISINELSKKFDKEFVVSDMELSIKPGEIVGFLGPNGAGKTTTLRMIAGVLPPTKGKVMIEGKDVSKDEDRIKKTIGFLPENNPLYEEMTVEEYLEFFAKIKNIKKEDKKEAVDFVVKSCGISSVFYRPIWELSKGFRQRVGLSQALLTKPEILILDEPSEGLDPNQRQEISGLIRELGKKRTVIISSHILSEIAKICNRLVIIHRGRKVADGSPDNLQTSKARKSSFEVEITGSGVLTNLKKIEGVSGVSEKKNNFYVLTAEKDKDIRVDVYKMCVLRKWTLLTMVQKEKELEEVFRQLTRN